MQTKSKGGKRFMLTFIDNFSRCSVVKFLAQKIQAKKAIEEFVNVLENQMGARVKAFRTDRGGEFQNKDMADLCAAAKGIVLQKAIPYSPQENGIAERLNRTLVERARALLGSFGLRKVFWAEAVNAAKYVRNRTVSRIHGKTPIEVLTGKPSFSHLRVFGSECYVHVPSAKMRKLDAVSQKGVFLGYEPNTKGYRVLKEDGSIEVTKDVTFLEGDGLDELGDARNLSRVSLVDSPGVGATPTGEVSTREDLEPEGGDDDGEILMLPEPQTQSNGEGVQTKSGTIDAPWESERTYQRGESKEGDEVQKKSRRYNLRGAEVQKASTLCPQNGWHRADLAKEEGKKEPQSYEEALVGEDAEFWQNAMDGEILLLLENKTWNVERPDSRGIETGANQMGLQNQA
jgi:hypothetical protein